MKLLLRVFERLRPSFEAGGRLGLLKPVFEALENALFAPDKRTMAAPHVRDPMDLKRYMTMAIIGILPCAFASIYFFGLRMLAVIVVSYAAGGAIEVVFAMVKKEEINEGFLVTGLIFPMVLPPGLPLWAVAVGVAFGTLVGKELFGGTGRNPFNPALVGRCFLALSYAKLMASSYLVPAAGWGWGNLGRYVTVDTVDAVAGATPLGLLTRGEHVSARDLFLGNVSGSAGETSAILIIAGGLFLVITKVANWRTVAATLGSYAIVGLILHAIRPATFPPAGWHMLGGGFLFGAFFMATDPVTSPSTNGGKWIYGGIIGVSTLLIRTMTGYVEGTMFAILLGNIAAPIIDEAAVRVRLRRLAHEG